MEMISVILHIDETRIVAALREAGGELNSSAGETVMDFSSVRRIDSNALNAMEELATIADDKKVKVVLRGVNSDVYKVLKLARLTRRFAFVN
jgi:anti-anti-sigma regulatory factor